MKKAPRNTPTGSNPFSVDHSTLSLFKLETTGAGDYDLDR
jgi:hypothetical protein